MKNETTAHNWTSKTEYIDIETGEVISKKNATTNYIVIKTTKKTEYGKYSNTREYTRLCERNRQGKLEL